MLLSFGDWSDSAMSSMDPTSLVAGAVAAGAAAALKRTATQAVKDVYSGLVTLIKDYYKAHSQVAESVEHLAKRPQDASRRTVLEGELKATILDVEQQKQLVARAHDVLRVIEAEDPDTARAVGVEIGMLRAAAINFKGVQPPEHGTAVRIREAHTKGTATFENIGETLRPK